VLARVMAADGTDLGAALVAAGLAKAYRGGRRVPWCLPPAR
jgi:endonuclease YncB( thermonuclease family)